MKGIYKIISPSGSIYIGQSVNIKDRWRRYFTRGAISQHALQRSFDKYGVSSHLFEVVHALPDDCDQVIMNSYEELYISQYKYCGTKLLNIKLGDGGGGKLPEQVKKKIGDANRGRKQTEKQRLQTSARMQGRPSWNKGVKGYKLNLSDEQRNNLSERAQNRTFKHSEESKLTMSANRKGKPILANRGKKFSDEHRKKMSEAKKGKKLSAEHIINMCINRTPCKGDQNHASKLTSNDVILIKKQMIIGVSCYRLAKLFHVGKPCISDIKNGKTWNHITV